MFSAQKSLVGFFILHTLMTPLLQFSKTGILFTNMVSEQSINKTNYAQCTLLSLHLEYSTFIKGVSGLLYLSHLMRSWHFSSSVFKRECATTQCLFGRTSSWTSSILRVCESEGSGETARMRRLSWAFAGCLCDKHHNLMSWLIFICIEIAVSAANSVCSGFQLSTDIRLKERNY